MPLMEALGAAVKAGVQGEALDGSCGIFSCRRDWDTTPAGSRTSLCLAVQEDTWKHKHFLYFILQTISPHCPHKDISPPKWEKSLSLQILRKKPSSLQARLLRRDKNFLPVLHSWNPKVHHTPFLTGRFSRGAQEDCKASKATIPLPFPRTAPCSKGDMAQMRACVL